VWLKAANGCQRFAARGQDGNYTGVEPAQRKTMRTVFSELFRRTAKFNMNTKTKRLQIMKSFVVALVAPNLFFSSCGNFEAPWPRHRNAQPTRSP
jgi:hypothetical protein